MASIYCDPSGRRMIQFFGPNRKRRSVRLGKVSQRAADAVRVHVERLVSASFTGHALPNDTSEWLAERDDVMMDRLARVGLVPKRDVATLGAFIDDYVASRGDVKSSTATVYGHTDRCLVEFFGEGKLLRDITPGDADAWRLWLLSAQELAENTVRRRCGIAKQFFRAAIRKKLISSNPFADLAAAVRSNKVRLYFVSLAETLKVLEACPDAERRLIFALSRFGGLRCPSEHLALRWTDVDWARARLRVPSPKTEHHEGGEFRFVPIFPELLPYLRDAFERAETGAEYVITRYRDAKQNLRTQFTKIVKRAGLKPWPKLFHNLRATRETELAATWPLHVVCSWIGNSQPIAAKHYLQVTDDDFQQAADPTARQNPRQQIAAEPRKASHAEIAKDDKPAACQELRPSAKTCDSGESGGMGDKGLERVA